MGLAGAANHGADDNPRRQSEWWEKGKDGSGWIPLGPVQIGGASEARSKQAASKAKAAAAASEANVGAKRGRKRGEEKRREEKKGR
ncbi:hypothetical protein AXG93_4284s1050 [Marchantia polymorpha subsp. ruderalis]|uniref:Uncharacterized protein n=1 Tax=Marchantia polymorpha subsp. ruderalis TaxID=1480154 RepID=A0A176VTS0_MARPO|nr:hypothetical protein AXG93_4284s1050 [Marchantia polymorpha subsp. ruderalis]